MQRSVIIPKKANQAHVYYFANIARSRIPVRPCILAHADRLRLGSCLKHIIKDESKTPGYLLVRKVRHAALRKQKTFKFGKYF